jgi:hypothetical protein
MNRKERRRMEARNKGRPENLTGVLIAMPAYGQVNNMQTTRSLFGLCQWLTVHNVNNQLLVYSAADIVEVRNLFLTVWYDANPHLSHMLFVDADMGFDPLMVRDMIRFGKPLTGTLYRRRQLEPSVVGTVLHEKHSVADVVDGFIPASGLGCGVMLISRHVVDVMLAKMPELRDALPSVLADGAPGSVKQLIRAFDPIREGSVRLSEDMSFCHRWRQCGGEIWANIRYPVSHIGPHDFDFCYEAQLHRNAFNEQLRGMVPRLPGEDEEEYGVRLATRMLEMKKAQKEAA